MTELKDRMKNHVGAAKKWLSQAEQSLEQDNEIKGKLNLMLAQAELKRAQEGKATDKRQFGYGSLLIHSMLVTGVAGLVLVVGFSGFNLEKTRPVVNSIVPIKTLQTQVPVKGPVIVGETESQGKVVLPKTENIPAAAESAADRGIDSAPVATQVAAAKLETEKTREVSVTSTQMQQLMRAAGKSLRGNE